MQNCFPAASLLRRNDVIITDDFIAKQNND